MKKLSLLFVLCAFSVLTFAQTLPPGPDGVPRHCAPRCPHFSIGTTSQEIHPDSPLGYDSPSSPIAPTARFADSPQLGVFNLGLLIDRNIRIGVFPEGEKILIRLACGSLVAHHRLRTAEL